MKIFALAITTALFTLSAQAETCKATVEQAALGHILQRAESAYILNTKLVSTKGQARHYLIELTSSDSDNLGSMDFPVNYYLVTAVGTQYECTVKNIKVK